MPRNTSLPGNVRARELMNTDVQSVKKDVHLGEVLRIMVDGGFSKLPVVDDGQVVGIVTDGAIADKLGAHRNRHLDTNTLYASSVMARSFRVARADDRWAHVVELLHGDPIQEPRPLGILPILEDGELAGVITRADFLPHISSEVPVGRLAVNDLITVQPTDRVVHARRVMLDHGIERLPVLDQDGWVCGIIAEMDIARALATMKRRVAPNHQTKHLERLLVRDAMVREPVTGPATMTVTEAAQRMHQTDVGCLPLVDGDGHPEGLVTRSDLMHVLERGAQSRPSAEPARATS